MKGDVKKLARKLRSAGYEIAPTNNGHYKLKLNGKTLYTLPSSPGENRAMKNLRADLRRKGLLEGER